MADLKILSPECARVALTKEIHIERALARVQRLSWWMDAAWRLPGTRFRLGYDALLGLVPGVGDLLGAGVSLYMIAEAARLGIGRWPLAKMVGNATIEAVVGAIPLLGDLFDAAFKANLRNARILETALRERVADDAERTHARV